MLTTIFSNFSELSITNSSFFFRRYGTKCGGCGQGISPSDLVRKGRDKVFHINCFTCLVCRKQPSTGEELYVIDDSKFLCKDDYLNGNKTAVIPSGPPHHQGKSKFQQTKNFRNQENTIKKSRSFIIIPVQKTSI